MKRYRIKNILKIIGDIFVPLLPGIICAGLCGAGASLATLCKFALNNGLSGLEFAWGIPGTASI